jgi:hypothetical protein
MMDKNELLYDHYKDTYSLHLEAKKRCNVSFVMLCIGITLLFCFLLDPVRVFESIYEMIKDYFSFELPFKSAIIQSFVWVMVFYLFIRYFQTSIYIERQYKYLEELENTISRSYEIKFDRESKSYENNYPLILSVIWIIYVWLFPILSIVIISLKICLEFINKVNIMSLIFDTIIAFLIIVLNIFYLIFILLKN